MDINSNNGSVGADIAAELHELGAIIVEPQRRLLGLDRMMARMDAATPNGSGERIRGNHGTSTPGSGTHTPLAVDTASPLPLASTEAVSPLSALFEYPELVPCVLEHLSRPEHVAAAMRVSHSWRWALRRQLYTDVWVRPWEAAPKRKLVGLFRTLAADAELCALVKSLDVRFFPLDLQGDELINLEQNVLAALGRMTNLTKLVWTRDRSISVELFSVITSLPVRSLELSGHSATYHPDRLGSMEHLEDLRIMMPDAGVRAVLPRVLAQLDARDSGGLRGLGLVCKASNLVNDTLLLELAPSLRRLKRLTLLGATRINKAGVYPILAAGGVEELVLDASAYSDLLDLSDAPVHALHTLSFSFPGPKAATLGGEDMPRLHAPSLRALELHLSSGQARKTLSLPGLHALSAQVDFGRLTRLALLGLVLDSAVLKKVIALAPGLEELYMSIASEATLADASVSFAPLGRLRIWHANAPHALPREILARVAATVPVEQIGSMNRVYEVVRREIGGQSSVLLTRWGRVQTPGYFRVWRP